MMQGASSPQQSLQELLREFKRYEDTIIVTGLLKIILGQVIGSKSDSMISIGGRLKRHHSDGQVTDLTPDLHAVYPISSSQELNGIVFEIKWGVSDNTMTLRNEVADFHRHFDELSEFPLMKNRSNTHNVVLVAYRDDVWSFQRVVDELFSEEPTGYAFLKSGKFAVFSWDRVQDKNGIEKFRLEKAHGGTGWQSLESCLVNPRCGSVKISEICKWRARVYAVADRPPVVYETWQLMRSLLNMFPDQRTKELQVTEDEIFDWLQKWHPPLTSASPPQISRNELREALQRMVSLGYNLSLRDWPDSELTGQTTYLLKNRIPQSKPLIEWIAKKIIKMESRKEKMVKKPFKARLPKPNRHRKRTARKKGHIDKTIPLDKWVDM